MTMNCIASDGSELVPSTDVKITLLYLIRSCDATPTSSISGSRVCIPPGWLSALMNDAVKEFRNDHEGPNDRLVA
jgi:hypothetical protein